MQAEQQSEREVITVASIRAAGGIVHSDGNIFFTNIDQLRAALSHPSTPQGWKQIGWTCGDGDCGRIHEAPSADGSYAVPVYVQDPPEQGSKG